MGLNPIIPIFIKGRKYKKRANSLEFNEYEFDFDILIIISHGQEIVEETLEPFLYIFHNLFQIPSSILFLPSKR